MNYKSNLNVVYSCKYHVVWRPKYRRKVLVNGADVRLQELIHEAAAEHRADILELEVMSDHLHLLVEVDPQFGNHRLVRLLKGAFFTDSAPGVPLAQEPFAHALDEFLLCLHGGRCTPCGYQAVYRESEKRLAPA